MSVCHLPPQQNSGISHKGQRSNWKSDLVMSGCYPHAAGDHCGASVAVGGCEGVEMCVGGRGGGGWRCGEDQ